MSSVKQAARSIGSVVGGYVAMALIVIAGTFVAMRAFGLGAGDEPTAGYLAANLFVSILGAFAAGWVCARLASQRPLAHVVALAVLVALLAMTARSMAGQPGWYPGAIAILALVGILGGGALSSARGRRPLPSASA